MFFRKPQTMSVRENSATESREISEGMCVWAGEGGGRGREGL